MMMVSLHEALNSSQSVVDRTNTAWKNRRLDDIIRRNCPPGASRVHLSMRSYKLSITVRSNLRIGGIVPRLYSLDGSSDLQLHVFAGEGGGGSTPKFPIPWSNK